MHSCRTPGLPGLLAGRLTEDLTWRSLLEGAFKRPRTRDAYALQPCPLALPRSSYVSHHLARGVEAEPLGHNKHGAGSRCTLQKQCRPPSPRRRWRCDRSSYKRSWFSSLACLFSFFLSFRVEGALGSLTPRLLNTQARSSLGSSKPDSDARTTTSRRTWRADVWESRAVQLLLPVRGCASARARARAHRSHANAMPSPSGNRSPSRQPAPRARRNIAARSRRRRR